MQLSIQMLSTMHMIRENKRLEKKSHSHHRLLAILRHWLAIIHEQLNKRAKRKPEIHDQMRPIAIDQLPQVVLDIVEARLVPERHVVRANVLFVESLYGRVVHDHLDPQLEDEREYVVGELYVAVGARVT